MTPQQKTLYAGDFLNRFVKQIAQPREFATDPQWPRLHPAVASCQQ
jgi:hypothetical protein